MAICNGKNYAKMRSSPVKMGPWGVEGIVRESLFENDVFVHRI